MNYTEDLKRIDSLGFPGSTSRIRSRKKPMLALLANVMRGSRSVVLQGNPFEKEMVLSFNLESPFPVRDFAIVAGFDKAGPVQCSNCCKNACKDA
jgi:hypothetical protein